MLTRGIARADAVVWSVSASSQKVREPKQFCATARGIRRIEAEQTWSAGMSPRENFQPGRRGQGKPAKGNQRGASGEQPTGKRPHRDQQNRAGKRSRFSDRMREHDDRSAGGSRGGRRPNWEPRDGSAAEAQNRKRKPRHGSRYDNSRDDARGRRERPDAERRSRFGDHSGGQRSSRRSDTGDSGRRDRKDGFDRRPRNDDARGNDRNRNGRGGRDFERQNRRGNDRSDRLKNPERNERQQRSDRRDRSERPQRRDSVYYPQPASKPYEDREDVLHDRLDAQPAPEDTTGTTFADLGLGAGIVGALTALGATQPFPIQAATIPAALTGSDVLGRGRTGSGKTIAFGAPVVEYLLRNRPEGRRAQGRPPRALILAPTRELADQINKDVQSIGRAVGIFTAVVTGGVRQHLQEKSLHRGVDILIGTPGRIEDLVEQRVLDLGRVEVAVLDEADHMAELGFVEPVQRILRQTRPDSQKLLFSATLDGEVGTLIDEFLRDPAVFEVVGETQETSSISHAVLVADRHDKTPVLSALAALGQKSVFFTRTRAYAEQLAELFAEQGIRAASLHGDLSQARRTRNLDRLKRGKVDVLVATDVAARGIHVNDIELIVQADPPDEHKAYVHRAGRTGRAGASGLVVTVIAPSRRRRMQQLLTNAKLQVPMIPVDATTDLGETLGITPELDFEIDE